MPIRERLGADRPASEPQSPGLSRRQFVRRAGGVAGLVAFGGAAVAGEQLLTRTALGKPICSYATTASGGVRAFRSQPDLHPPTVDASSNSRGRGYVFLGPWPAADSQGGPLVVDERGEPVWFRPLGTNQWATNVGVQSYRGQSALVWWEGAVLDTGYGQGEGVVLDSSYGELTRIVAAGERQVDLHELRLTPEGTALFTCYPQTVPADLSSVGGPKQGSALESVIQEVDLGSGRLVMEWRSLDHIPVSDSYLPLSEPYDYLHANSIDILADGNLLVSARHTHALYKLDRRTGAVIWRLGGKSSDFEMGSGAAFAWQHDARQVGEDKITVFDDESAGPIASARQSRGIMLKVDTRRRRVSLARAYTHPEPLLATAMGNVQALPNGHVLVGWGTASYVSEFAADGRLVADVRLPSQSYSYRGFGFPWRAAAPRRPAVAAGQDQSTGARLLYVSWNGATDITRWQLHAGVSRSHLKTIGVAHRRGFETAIPLSPGDRFAAVTAVDRSGGRVATSDVIRI